MEKKEKGTRHKENQYKGPETFHNHWGTGKFLGPNTLRYEKNKSVYEREE